MAELARRVADRVQDRLMAGDPWAADPCSMDAPGYRERYYKVFWRGAGGWGVFLGGYF
jgi:hypothetical protein